MKLTAELKKATTEANGELAQAIATVDALVSELQSRSRRNWRRLVKIPAKILRA